MIDHGSAYRLFDERASSAAADPVARRVDGYRRVVWQTLVDAAEDNLQVTMSIGQIAVAVGAAAGRGPANYGNVHSALRWLRERGLVEIAEKGGGTDNRANTFRLRLTRPAPVLRQRQPARDPRLRAFDERAAVWTPERRRTWRAVWRAIRANTDSDGRFVGAVDSLADTASDLPGTDVADRTVAKILDWTVATGLTRQIWAGQPHRYEVRVGGISGGKGPVSSNNSRAERSTPAHVVDSPSDL